MNFLQTDLAKFFWLIICIAVFVSLMVGLFKSAGASLKRTGGNWKSVLDEVAVGIVVIICFVIVAQMSPYDVYTKLSTPIIAIFNMFISFLRQVGVPL